MSDIQATTKSIRDVFKDQFAIGAYQREYEWKDEHVKAMAKDLVAAFRPRLGALGSKGYFLGPIITTSRKGVSQLIDGQQRLTTVALILLFLTRRIKEGSAGIVGGFASSFDGRLKASAYSKIFTETRRTRALTLIEIDGEVREPESDLEEAISKGFSTISEELSTRIDDQDLTLFLDWLLDKVTFAEIKAGETYDPFSLFDAMNSRGLGLQGMAQFRSYVNRRFGDDRERRTLAMEKFQSTLESVQGQGHGADHDFVSSWIGARCADIVGTVPAKPADARKQMAKSVLSDVFRHGPFFAIEHGETRRELGLTDPGSFIDDHWCTFGEAFNDIRMARKTFNADLQGMFFIEQVGFDIDLYDEILLLAACKPGSDENLPRIQMALQFMENIAARWTWTTRVKGLTARSADRLKFILARAATEIRGKSNKDMALSLTLLQKQLRVSFSDNPDISHPATGTSPAIHALLARLAAFLDELDGRSGTYGIYSKRGSGADTYDIEHFLPRALRNCGDENGHSFRRPDEYRKYRQKLGALTLLTHIENNGFAATPFPQKRQSFRAFNSGNLLTKSLEGGHHLSRPVAKWLVENSIDFPTIDKLSRESINARQKALIKLAEHVWSEDRILALAGLSAETAQVA